MNIDKLQSKSREHVERISSAHDIGYPINASKLCAQYGKTIKSFRTESASYDPLVCCVENHRPRNHVVDELGEVWVTKTMAFSVLQFCDVQFRILICGVIGDLMRFGKATSR